MTLPEKKTIDETEFKGLTKNLQQSIIKYALYLVASITLCGACGLVFFYIEHCYSVVPRPLTGSEVAFQEICYLVNSSRYDNQTLLKGDLLKMCTKELGQIDADRTKDCTLTLNSFLTWFDYSYVISLTIGYGNTVTYSDLGKVATIILAVPLIGMTAINLTYAGETVVTITKIIMVRVESLALWITLAVFSKSSIEDITTYVDAIYFTFISLTTIGFGDFHFKSAQRINTMVISVGKLILFNIAMATVASVITGISELAKNLKLTKLSRLSGTTNKRKEEEKTTLKT